MGLLRDIMRSSSINHYCLEQYDDLHLDLERKVLLGRGMKNTSPEKNRQPSNKQNLTATVTSGSLINDLEHTETQSQTLTTQNAEVRSAAAVKLLITI